VARQLLRGVEESASVVVTRRVEGRQVVRVQGSASAITGFLAPAIARFVEAFPGVQVHLAESERDDLLLSVSRGEVDIVACRRPAVIPESWDYHVLRDDRFVVVCAPTHPLARRRKLAWRKLADQPWLLAPAGSAARTRFEELAQQFPDGVVSYPVVTRVLSATWQLLHDRPCLCLLPHSFVRHLLESGALATVAVDAPLHMEPLGVLVPKSNVGEATGWMRDFLLKACTSGVAGSRKGAAARRAQGGGSAR
jgi:DNA-binding transcriptional LysR family regulator